jgi:hypothetical protein
MKYVCFVKIFKGNGPHTPMERKLGNLKGIYGSVFRTMEISGL